MRRATKRSTKTTKRSSAKKVAKKSSKPAVKKKPQTAEQVADVSRASNSFEGMYHLDKLPFADQMNQIFNPLHAITKTVVGDNNSASTYVVNPPEKSGK